MRIVRKQYTIRQISEGYLNNNEEGVTAFGGQLNVRPPYQREFVYKDKQKNKSTYLIKDADGSINGKPTYARILIKRRETYIK